MSTLGFNDWLDAEKPVISPRSRTRANVVVADIIIIFWSADRERKIVTASILDLICCHERICYLRGLKDVFVGLKVLLGLLKLVLRLLLIIEEWAWSWLLLCHFCKRVLHIGLARRKVALRLSKHRWLLDLHLWCLLSRCKRTWLLLLCERGLCDERRVSEWVSSWRICSSKWRLILYGLHRFNLLGIRRHCRHRLQLELWEIIRCSRCLCLERLLFRWLLGWKRWDDWLQCDWFGDYVHKRRICNCRVVGLRIYERVVTDYSGLQKRVCCLLGLFYGHPHWLFNILLTLRDEARN